MDNLNLLDHLVPGIKIYSVIHNGMRNVLRIEYNSDFPIVIGLPNKGNRPIRFNKNGSVLKDGKECLLFPDKDTITWEGYVIPYVFHKGDIVKAYDNNNGKILIAIYSHYDIDKQTHYCFHSTTEDGIIEYSEHNKIENFRKCEGFLFNKSVYSKSTIKKYNRQKNIDNNEENNE
jgi:hypothetical protein